MGNSVVDHAVDSACPPATGTIFRVAGDIRRSAVVKKTRKRLLRQCDVEEIIKDNEVLRGAIAEMWEMVQRLQLELQGVQFVRIDREINALRNENRELRKQIRGK